MSFLTDVKTLRDRARQQINEGAVTPDYQLDPDAACKLLNEALATELVCVLRYKFHYFMASGIHKEGVASHFLEHANEEQAHADQIAERIKQLGGKPEMDPSILSQNASSEYVEGESIVDMIRENLVAERIAIQTYREMIAYFGEKDSTTRVMLEGILAMEEEHADDMADLLFAVNPETEEVTKLVNPDEQGMKGQKVTEVNAPKAQKKAKKSTGSKSGK